MRHLIITALLLLLVTNCSSSQRTPLPTLQTKPNTIATGPPPTTHAPPANHLPPTPSDTPPPSEPTLPPSTSNPAATSVHPALATPFATTASSDINPPEKEARHGAIAKNNSSAASINALADSGKSAPPATIGIVPDRHRPSEGRKHGGVPNQSTTPETDDIDDNDRCNAYLDFHNSYEDAWIEQIPHREPYVIAVADLSDEPVHNAHTEVTLLSTPEEPAIVLRTHTDGRAIYHPPNELSTSTLRFIATSANHTAQSYVHRAPNGRPIKPSYFGTPTLPSLTPLDIMFLLDVTGSMADEIKHIKKTLTSITHRITDLPGNPDLRMTMVVYQDHGGTLVTRTYNFDNKPQCFTRSVPEVKADGDNYPKSLNEALHQALNSPSWRSDAVKLVFLLADAPPHLDYHYDHSYITEMKPAGRTGTKIFTLASSSLDTQGEYIFRQLTQQTLIKFIFILYDSGPQDELTTPHEVGDDFSVDRIDYLIVRIITEEMSHIASNN